MDHRVEKRPAHLDGSGFFEFRLPATANLTIFSRIIVCDSTNKNQITLLCKENEDDDKNNIY